jgi:hypothetical protein
MKFHKFGYRAHYYFHVVDTEASQLAEHAIGIHCAIHHREQISNFSGIRDFYWKSARFKKIWPKRVNDSPVTNLRHRQSFGIVVLLWVNHFQ